MNYIITFLISMIPLVELRGAVPYAISSGIPLWQALLIGVIGNMLPVPIIFFFARHILEWGKEKPVIGNFFTWCLNKGHRGGQKLEEAAGDKGIFWALLLTRVRALRLAKWLFQQIFWHKWTNSKEKWSY